MMKSQIRRLVRVTGGHLFRKRIAAKQAFEKTWRHPPSFGVYMEGKTSRAETIARTNHHMHTMVCIIYIGLSIKDKATLNEGEVNEVKRLLTEINKAEFQHSGYKYVPRKGK